ncbi:hypothetical protein ACHAP5_012081 [Fusarium lateritium]
MEISTAKTITDGGEDDVHEIMRDDLGASPATDLRMSFVGYDQPAIAEPITKPEGVPSITVTTLKYTTATSSSDGTGTDSTTAASTAAADGGEEDKDNAAGSFRPANAACIIVSALLTTSFFRS